MKSSGNGDQLKVLAREVRALRREIHNPQSTIQNQVDRAVALADKELGFQMTPLEPASGDPNAGQAGIGGLVPTAPFRPVGQPSPARSGPMMSDETFGVSGTPIVAGFLTDLGEYNPELIGRNAVRTYEQMRRGDAQVRATLAAMMLPIQSAKWNVVPATIDPRSERDQLQIVNPAPSGTSSTGEGKTTGAKAKEIAAFVKQNLFSGLEFRTSTGGWATQTWDEVVRNALLMLTFGCAIHEDVWRVDGEKIRLRKLASRQPLTFYRWHTEADGETLLAVEQYGYRGGNFMNVLLPADKVARFTFNQEGANFWGIALSRAMYPHWYIKTQLYRIDAIACERNALGVPMWRLSPGFSSQDRDAAYNFVTQLATHEATGGVEPPGDQYSGLRIVGYEGRLRDVLPTIEHHNVMISRAALALFMDLGQAQHGSRALGKEHSDFFMLALQNVADQIAFTIANSSIRRLVAYNFGEGAPVPRLVAANVQARALDDIVDALSKFAQAGLVVSEENLRKFIREELGLPEESKEAVVAIKGETVAEGPAGAGSGVGGQVSGKGAEPVGGQKPTAIQNSSHTAGRIMNSERLPESAKHYDRAAHEDQADRTAIAVASALRAARFDHVRALAQRLAATPLANLVPLGAGLPFDHSLAGRVKTLLSPAFQFGAAQVYRERSRVTGRSPNLSPQNLSRMAGAEGVPRGGAMAKKPGKQPPDGQMIAEASVADYSNQLSSRATSAAVDLHKDGLEGDDLEQGIVAAVEGAADGWIDRIGIEAGRQSIFGGRYSSLRDLDSEVERYVRIEGNYGTPRICPPCEAGHGTEWASLDAVDWQRGDACAGDLWADWIHGQE